MTEFLEKAYALVPLLRPSSDTAVLVRAAVMGLKAIYQKGFQLSKAGVVLMDLRPAQVRQGELDFGSPEDLGRGKLMVAMDALNSRLGRGAVFLASTGNKGDKRVWSMKQERRTPANTTRLADFPVVRA